jgi:hypothetical protein
MTGAFAPPPLAICAAVSAARSHGVPVELFHVGVPGGVALLDAHAEPHRHASRGALQDSVVEDEAARGAVLEEEVGVVAAAGQGDRQELLGDGGVDGG